MELVRCSLAPSGTVAVVQYTEAAQAKRAFQKLAFSRYRHVPLYLEWAPEDVFTGAGKTAAGDAKATEGGKEVAEEEAADGEEVRGCLFVKNLSFSTSDEGLKAAFQNCKGFRSAVVMRKKAAVGKEKGDAKGLSMGYGFIEFTTAEQAADVLRRKQGLQLDGHAIQLQISQRNAQRGSGAAAAKKVKSSVASSRLCVRNLAFEANRKELYQLFSAYGSVTAVRIPKKSDYSGHRGFAFIDFASKSEAAAAFEALQHTHLYGRRLVIEVAEEKATDVGSVQEATLKRQAAKELKSEAKKRRKAGVLNAPGGATSFEDALL